MKLRKILASTVAVVACVAMLSTNVLAATFTTGASGDKLTVTINSDETAQATFLAVDAGTVLADVEGSDIQYIDQGTIAEIGNIAFAKRAGGADKVDLYSGGENIEMFSMTSVYVAAAAEVVPATYSYACINANDEFATADLDAYFKANALKVNYAGIGASAPAEVVYSAETASKFTLTRTTTDNVVYTIAVKYDGIDAGSVTVNEADLSPMTGITVTAANTPDTLYVDDISALDAVKAAIIADVKALGGITIKTVHEDPEVSGTLTLDDVTINVSDSFVVSFAYGEFTAATTITYTVIPKAVVSGVVVGGTTATLTTRDAATVTENDAIKAVKDAGIKVTYTWNYGATSDANDLTYSAVKDGDVWKVTITGSTELTDNVITVTVEVKTAFGITGKVTAANTSGQLFNFGTSIPVGAVITAIPVSATNMSYVGNVSGVSNLANTASYSAIVDASGNFSLDLEPGEYHVIVSHSMYVMRKMGAASQLTLMRTILDGQSKQVITIGEDVVDMGTITLRYAYYGDMNLDGTLNPSDYGTFKGNFNKTVPEIQ